MAVLQEHYRHITRGDPKACKQSSTIEALTLLQAFETPTEHYSPVAHQEMLHRILSLRAGYFSQLLSTGQRTLAKKMASVVLHLPLLKITIASEYQQYNFHHSGMLLKESREAFAYLVVSIIKDILADSGADLAETLKNPQTDICLFYMDPTLRVVSDLFDGLFDGLLNNFTSEVKDTLIQLCLSATLPTLTVQAGPSDSDSGHHSYDDDVPLDDEALTFDAFSRYNDATPDTVGWLP